MLLRIERTCEVVVGLATRDGSLVGFEGSAVEAEPSFRASIWARLLEDYQERILEHVCGPRRRPLVHGRRAPFCCPACGGDRGFRRRGHRSRRRGLLTRLGRMDLTLAQVACPCGRRFAPLLQLLGVESGSRISPGIARRVAELATELPFARTSVQLRRETGHGLSTATVRRLVRRAGRRCDLTVPRDDLAQVPAMLIDGTRVPAGPRFGRRRSARGVECNAACAVVGRDTTGRRPRAAIELVGASVGEPWERLAGAIRAPNRVGIIVTDGDNGIENLLDRTLPRVPRQHCTFHIHHNIRLRLWQDGVAFKDRDALADRLLAPILAAPTRTASLRALEQSITFAEDHDFTYVAQHLRHVGPQLSTWKAVRRSRRPWQMDGRVRPEHTTSLLERTMREINRRVDPPGNRWLVPGVRSMVNLILARRFNHPAWRALWQDAGAVRAWAGLRGSTQ